MLPLPANSGEMGEMQGKATTYRKEESCLQHLTHIFITACHIFISKKKYIYIFLLSLFEEMEELRGGPSIPSPQ